MQKYIPTIGVDYGVKPVRLGDYEVRALPRALSPCCLSVGGPEVVRGLRAGHSQRGRGASPCAHLVMWRAQLRAAEGQPVGPGGGRGLHRGALPSQALCRSSLIPQPRLGRLQGEPSAVAGPGHQSCWCTEPGAAACCPPFPPVETQVRNEFYKDSQGCLLVYDVTNRASFEALQHWLSEAREYGADNMVSTRAAKACWGVLWCAGLARRAPAEQAWHRRGGGPGPSAVRQRGCGRWALSTCRHGTGS